MSDLGLFDFSDEYDGREDAVQLEVENNDLRKLLAAKDARIAELESRQITPEMIDVWNRLQGMKATQTPRYVVNNTSDLRSDLWHAFIAMMQEIQS